MAGNLLPLIAVGAGVLLLSGKKKRRKKKEAAPPGPPPPIPGEEELPPEEEGEPPPEEEPPDPGMTGGAHEGPEPGKAVASGVERHRTGAYPWKILFTFEGDYAAHYYPAGHRGPHEEVLRAPTVEEAISAFQLWADNEDRRKRNLPPVDEEEDDGEEDGEGGTQAVRARLILPQAQDQDQGGGEGGDFGDLGG